MRLGLSQLKDEAMPAHPVEVVLQQAAAFEAKTKRQLLEQAYGSAFTAKMDIERQILDRNLRLPGLPSSKLSLEAWSGALEDFGFEDYLGDPRDSELPAPDTHSLMEAKLGMTQRGTSLARPAM
jgi:proteasome maturation protein